MYLNTSTGLPWLNSPVMLHSSRMDMCKLTPEQCAYRSGHWRYWYQADHVYGLNTIYFLCAVSGLFALAHLWNRTTATAGTLARASNNPAVAGLRYLSYRSFYIRAFSWYSPVLGVILLGLAGFVYFMGMRITHILQQSGKVDTISSHDTWSSAILLAKYCNCIVWIVATNCNSHWFHGLGPVSIRDIAQFKSQLGDSRHWDFS